MKHCGTQKLETDRLILRRYVSEDAAAMYKNWASDSEVTKYLMWQTHSDETVSQSIINEWLKEYSNDNYYHWAIVLKENGDEPIGDIAVVHMNEEVSMMHIGYCIGRAWWHQGITSEALAGVIRFLFEDVGMERVEARHDVNNPNSGKVMEKCGMRKEGVMRRADRNNQGIVDCCIHAILRDEWKK